MANRRTSNPVPVRPSPLHYDSTSSALDDTPSPPALDNQQQQQHSSSVAGYPNPAGFPPGSPPFMATGHDQHPTSVSRSNSQSRVGPGPGPGLARSSSITRAVQNAAQQFAQSRLDTPFEDDQEPTLGLGQAGSGAAGGTSRPSSAWGSPLISPSESPVGNWSVNSHTCLCYHSD